MTPCITIHVNDVHSYVIGRVDRKSADDSGYRLFVCDQKGSPIQPDQSASVPLPYLEEIMQGVDKLAAKLARDEA